MDFTEHKDINAVLHSLIEGMKRLLGVNLVGVYLTGSLSYGDFNRDSSDIDIVAILLQPATSDVLKSLKELHLEVEARNTIWFKRIECSYVTLDMLKSIEPPKTSRPYIGEGIFYPEAPYGNEWIINQYLLYRHGNALLGQDFKSLIKPIDILEVRKACVRDLFEEWEPKINDPVYLQNSHYQSYVVLNLCRILYTVIRHATASKRASAEWVISEFPAWDNLIIAAQNWHYGVEMNLQGEVVEFIKFAVNKVKEAQLSTSQ